MPEVGSNALGLNSKIPLNLIPFAPNFEEIFFSTLISYFLEVKRLNKVENAFL